jgi:hypothetical protein
VDSNVNPAPVTLACGGVDATIDFGFLPHGSIGGRVWNDANGDGVQDASEGGLVGWTLSIRALVTRARKSPVRTARMSFGPAGGRLYGLRERAGRVRADLRLRRWRRLRARRAP